ncbi:MAG: Hsp70 family protein [Victivallales bacterium]|nr:Hsp70 family protein [Victivallales bacterium]
MGGSSRMPQVKEAIQRLLPKAKISLYDPDECVAKGAALVAEQNIAEDGTDGEGTSRLYDITSKFLSFFSYSAPPPCSNVRSLGFATNARRARREPPPCPRGLQALWIEIA